MSEMEAMFVRQDRLAEAVVAWRRAGPADDVAREAVAAAIAALLPSSDEVAAAAGAEAGSDLIDMRLAMLGSMLLPDAHGTLSFVHLRDLAREVTRA